MNFYALGWKIGSVLSQPSEFFPIDFGTKTRKNCSTGYNCGGSCISTKKKCRVAVAGEAKTFAEYVKQNKSKLTAIQQQKNGLKSNTTTKQAKAEAKTKAKAEAVAKAKANAEAEAKTKAKAEAEAKAKAEAEAAAKAKAKGKIDSYDKFSTEIVDAYKQLNKDYNYEDLVPIHHLRQVMGNRMSRSQFDNWLIEMQANDKFQLMQGDMSNVTPKQKKDGLDIPDVGMRNYAKITAEGAKLTTDKQKDKKAPTGIASKITRKQFDKEVIDTYERLNRENAYDDLVPIYHLRRAMGDQVSRSDFTDWLVDMQAKDKFQLMAGEMPDMTPDKREDSIIIPDVGLRYYAKRLRSN